MHEDATAAVKAGLNETVGLREVLQQVLVVDVVDLDDMVLVGAEQRLVERQAQHRQHVGDVCLGERVAAAQGEEAAAAPSARRRVGAGATTYPPM